MLEFFLINSISISHIHPIKLTVFMRDLMLKKVSSVSVGI